jgi:transmembrane sensor
MTQNENISRLYDLSAIEGEAAHWVARLDRGDVSPDEAALFETWKAQSVHHARAAERLSGLWAEMSVLADLSQHSAPAARPVTDWLAALLPTRAQPWPMAGIAAALVLSVVSVWTITQSPITDPVARYTTQVGEQRTINLADGSSIQLNTDSLVEVLYRPGGRDLRLMKGEAFFDVAPDPARPFSVYTDNGVVRAVGTAFVVRLDGPKVEVTVTKGTVELAGFNAPPKATDLGLSKNIARQPLSLVSANNGRIEKAVLAQNVVTHVAMAPPDAARGLSWRQGMLIFAGDPLAAVVKDVTRYTDIEIEIADPKLDALKVGGYFKVGEVEPMLEALVQGFGVRVERVSAKHVRLISGS